MKVKLLHNIKLGLVATGLMLPGAIIAEESLDAGSTDALHEGFSTTDREELKINKRIQNELTRDNTLSMQAKKAYIDAEGGDLILKGKVASVQERRKVETSVAKVLGTKHFKSQLTLAQR